MKNKVYCFDFDGTLTTNDSLLEFIKYAKGTSRFLMVFLMYSPILVLMKLHLYPNWKAKQQIFAHLFAGMRIEKFDKICKKFAEDNQHLLRPQGINLIHKVLGEGAKVYVVSASIDNWVRPFFQHRGITDITVLCSQFEVVDGKVTGHFKTNNRYGEEKVHRICDALTTTTANAYGTTSLSFDRTQYNIEAFGDSRGDKEMLAFADTGHYKPFRES